ncbi:MAG: glutamate--tRNA ligase family protein [Akkermansiaceae bacterium]|nr:glutamate--tRNA ligase family protein [Akkermansiaceae bacterium]MDG2323630.1 glutamate--tRNA ligase family protein [Akkermansiaceae bacterium]
MSAPVRTRFAPSPTGYLHLGGARTALFNWLFAKKHGGSCILRVEDTDEARNTEEARAAIFEGMEWLGLDWEGPGNEGDAGPYFQSKRTSIYQEWFEKLKDADRVYEDDGAWRFRFERKLITMNDLVCGEVSIDYTNEENTPDMVVRRSDGSFVFHFVNVVDDLTMGITHVIRGEDHLMNTPKHLQLIEAFGAIPPAYAHIPLILNSDGSKMSKRDEGAAVGDYPRQGFLSDAVVNFIALLGWSPKDESEIFSPAQLIEKFSLENINRSPGRFDIEKCKWVNQQHLLKLSTEEFAAACNSDATPAMLASVQEKVSLLTEIPDAVAFYLDPDYPIANDALDKVKKNQAAGKLLTALAVTFTDLSDWSEAKSSIGETAKENGAKPGQLMFPLRVALSGKSGGPDLGAILEILGQEECVRRINRFTALLS